MSGPDRRAPQGGGGGAGGGGYGGGAGGGGAGGGGGKKKRTVTLTFSPAQLISSVAGLGIIIVWVFILGVVLGKGYTPESHIPELAKMMPKGEGAEAPRVISPDTPLSNATAGVAAGTAEGGESSEVIQPGDMAYRQSLKNTPGQRTPAARTPAQTTTPATTPPARASTPPAQAGSAAAALSAAQNRQAQPGTQPVATTQAVQPAAGSTFNYVYQVAAYKDQPSCDALVAKLKQAGFGASTEKSESNGSTWYKTLITFKGTPDDINTLRTKLSAHKLDRLILRSKTPTR